MLVANNAPNFERNDLDIHFFRYSGGDHSGAAIWGAHDRSEAATWEARLPWKHGHSGERGIRGCGPKPDDPPAALPPKSKLACKLAYNLRLPPYAACLRLP